jgi:hypothetical protein
VRAALRAAFARWGAPGRLRFDNGAPWGSWGDLPTELALWRLGLDIGLIWNRPRHCQANGVVERAHGVCQQWAEPAACADVAALAERLAWAAELQRERYPAVGGRSRLAAYPALGRGGRPYDPSQEDARWEEQRVWRFLAAGGWRRRVDQVGRISLYNRAVTVGRRHAGEPVLVRFRAERDAPTWVLLDEGGREIRRQPAPELSRERILAMEVAYRKPSRQRADPVQPDVAHEA